MYYLQLTENQKMRKLRRTRLGRLWIFVWYGRRQRLTFNVSRETLLMSKLSQRFNLDLTYSLPKCHLQLILMMYCSNHQGIPSDLERGIKKCLIVQNAKSLSTAQRYSLTGCAQIATPKSPQCQRQRNWSRCGEGDKRKFILIRINFFL